MVYAPIGAPRERTARLRQTKTASTMPIESAKRRAALPLESSDRGKEMNVASAAAAARPAPIRYARRKPSVSACGTCEPPPIRLLVRCVASVIRTARPRPPPIWREVFTSPDARPACPSLAPWVAAIVEGTMDIPIPAAIRIPGSMM